MLNYDTDPNGPELLLAAQDFLNHSQAENDTLQQKIKDLEGWVEDERKNLDDIKHDIEYGDYSHTTNLIDGVHDIISS